MNRAATTLARHRRSHLPSCSRSGVALLITLLTLALMTIIVVAFMSTMGWEVQASRRNFETQRAQGLANLGLGISVGQLRTALGQWDNPYGNFLTNAPTNYWSVSPGILTAWSYTNVANNTALITNYPLFSVPNPPTTNLVNLNAPGEDGVYPILGTATPLNVYWVNVLANPANTTASPTNQIVGRYAFWMDDENAKININTADGTYNTNVPPQQCGLGPGTPSAVSLQELTSGGSGLSTTAASNIVAIARTIGFNSPREILRASGTTLDTYTNNIFNLTVFSRSPDINIFGQPKIPLIPSNQTNLPYVGLPENSLNLATLLPLKELFPSQYGTTGESMKGVLPPTPMSDPYSDITSTNGAFVSNYYSQVKWPLTFKAQLADYPTINNPVPYTAAAGGSGDNNIWDNGKLIADYLAGTNAMGKPITWPALPGSSATTYLGKYTPRQIDSIAMQIVNLVAVDFAPDMANVFFADSRSSDYVINGWLSGKLVNGVGRHVNLDKVLMKFTTYGGVFQGGTPATYGPPTITAELYMELYTPSRYQGTSLFHNTDASGEYYLGGAFQTNLVNCQDMGWKSANTVNPSALPKLPPNCSGLTDPYAIGNAPSIAAVPRSEIRTP